MLDMLGVLSSLGKLKSAGDKIVASQVTAQDLVEFAAANDIKLDLPAATNMALKIPEYVNSLEETMTDFVSNGGLIRMLVAQYTGEEEHTVGTCRHCGNYVFF